MSTLRPALGIQMFTIASSYRVLGNAMLSLRTRHKILVFLLLSISNLCNESHYTINHRCAFSTPGRSLSLQVVGSLARSALSCECAKLPTTCERVRRQGLYPERIVRAHRREKI
jgi:hypothetical protein